MRCGFRWERSELAALRSVLRRLKVRPLVVADEPLKHLLAEHWAVTGRGVPSARAAWDSVYLPGRNLVLLTQGALLAQARGLDAVALGVLKGNPFPDARPTFLRRVEAAFSACFSRRVRVLAPYLRLTKRQVLARAAGLPVERTLSCLQPRGLRPCLRCSKCEERRAWR